MTTFELFGMTITWDATLRNVVLCSIILGVTSGVLGCFAVLRRQSLIGDAVAHAALPGICLMYMITGTRSSELLLIGGAIAGLVGVGVLIAITRNSITKPETGLGIVLSVFFGFGILLLTHIQHTDDAGQSGLDRFIFGQAATILPSDVRTMGIVATLALGTVWLLFKEFKLLAFDPDFAATLGMRTGVLGAVLASLLVMTVMIGLQTVGVILMVSLLIAPAVAARQWTGSLSGMILLSGVFGMLSGVSGAVLSSLVDRLPTGPMIVIAASLIVMVSLLFAPNRGVVSTLRMRRRRARQFQAALEPTIHHRISA
ncbi:MAG TPA: iron chelate uptake ABC transporter family permease subunit [Thermomicrobiales bacterium]|nr:iron chelate uptake ABC transporter family permease subunit [Thermomicrobiales bacterium]